MRTFFSIPVSERHRETLAQIAGQLRARTHMRASWVVKENYHITLRFLGDIDPLLTVDLHHMCREAASKVEPFECVLDHVGAFPAADRARVLWIGGEMPLSFERLSRLLSQRLTSLGFPRTKNEQGVHVTVARIKDRPDPVLPEVIEQFNPIQPIPQMIDQVVMMESTLSAQGSVYTPLFSVPLGRMR